MQPEKYLSKSNKRKPLFTIGVFFLCFALISCSENPPIVVEDHTCGAPVLVNGRPREVAIGYRGQKVSHDGKKMAYVVNEGSSFFYVMDLNSQKSIKYDLKQVIADGHQELYCTRLLWSPYSSERILLDCFGYYDSLGTSVYRRAIYIYDFERKVALRSFPSDLGKYGINNGTYWIYSWIKGSTSLIDSLLVPNGGVYVPQEDSVYHPNKTPGEIVWESPTSSDVYKVVIDSTKTGRAYLNQNEIEYYKYWIANDVSPHWSPSGNKIAISCETHVLPPIYPNQYRWEQEIWVLDVPTFKMTPVGFLAFYRINIQQLYCNYSFWGLDAEFLTDSTLAVSMHKDGADVSNIWEITLDGRLVRQLTVNQ